MRSLAAIILLSGLVTPLAQAQDWLPDPALADAAIATQPTVRAAMRRVDAAGAQARARAIGVHEFEVSAIPQVRRTDVESGNRHYNEFEAQLGRAFRWPGKVTLDRKIGEFGVTAAELRLDDARHQAARTLLERWIGWLRAAERRHEAELQAASLSRELAALTRRVQLGDAAQKDLDLLTVEGAQAEASLVSTQGELTDAQAALANDFPSLPLPDRVPTVGEPRELPETSAAWVERIIQRSHEIAAIEADADQADTLAARARADRLPDPTLGLRVMSDRGGAERALGLVFSMPIGGRHRSALADAEEANAAARHNDAAAMRRDTER
ncbi:MAG: TolC family protein, partial [Dokdonella sp.]